jgi:hypothetical protein
MHVIVEDLTRAYPFGMLVENERAAMLAGEGVTTLAVEPALFSYSSVGGFFQRFYGHGVEIPSVPGSICKSTLHVVPYMHTIRWIARLAPTQKFLADGEGRLPTGMLRLVTDSSQANCQSGGLSNVEGSILDLSKVGEPNVENAWIVKAQARVDVPAAMQLGFALYGHARDLKISWLAISQTE